MIVDFWAPVVRPCRSFAQVFEQASKCTRCHLRQSQYRRPPSWPGRAHIRSITTLMVSARSSRGVLFSRSPGALSASLLEGLITQVIGLDMTEVHAEDSPPRKKALAKRTKDNARYPWPGGTSCEAEFVLIEPAAENSIKAAGSGRRPVSPAITQRRRFGCLPRPSRPALGSGQRSVRPARAPCRAAPSGASIRPRRRSFLR